MHEHDALIWGASDGMGTTLVNLLKDNDWRVFALARHMNTIPDAADFKLKFVADDIHTFQEANLVIADETDGIDLVVYAAGDLRAEKWNQLPLPDWNTVLSSNLTGAFLAASHSLNLMKPEGHIVFIGAYVDHLILPKMGAYAVAKAGLEPMVATLRKEHRKMRFTIVRPGAVDTAFWEHAPFRRPGDAKSPEDVALVILRHHETQASGDLNL